MRLQCSAVHHKLVSLVLRPVHYSEPSPQLNATPCLFVARNGHQCILTLHAYRRLSIEKARAASYNSRRLQFMFPSMLFVPLLLSDQTH
jgi:hypothetical protein